METAMTFPKARLIVSAVLFLAWLGFLLYLVGETKNTVISKPQVQIAQAVVIVAVRDDGGKADPTVTVKEQLGRNDNDEALRQLAGRRGLAGQQLRLTDLLGCKKGHGYVGAGDYVIPLMRRAGAWQIAAIPTPGYSRPHPSHGALELRDAGPYPECVLWRLLEYAGQKPGEADGLLEPLMPAMATCYLGQSFFGEVYGPVLFGADFHWQTWIDLPRGRLPSRLPIADALELKAELEKCKAKVEVSVEEVRIYPLTPEVRAQVEAVITGKK
jgi:hypothetical protein